MTQEKNRPAGRGTPVGPKVKLTRCPPESLLSVPGNRQEILYLHADKNGVETYYRWPPRWLTVTPIVQIGGYQYCFANWSASPTVPWYWRQRHMPQGAGWEWTGEDGGRMPMRRRVPA